MKRHHGYLLVITCAFSLIAAVDARATDVFDDGSLNVIAAPSVDIEVRDSNVPAATTVVNLAGGQIGFALNGDGTIMMAEVLDDSVDPPVSFDPPVFEPVVSNEDQSVAVFDNSIFNLLGGDTADSVVGNDNAVIGLNGGTIGDDVILNNNAQASIAGPTFDDLVLNDASIGVMTDGELDTLEMSGASQFIFTGGLIDDLDAATGDTSLTFGGTARFDDDVFFAGSTFVMNAGPIVPVEDDGEIEDVAFPVIDDELYIGSDGEEDAMENLIPVPGPRVATINGGTIFDDLNLLGEGTVVNVNDVQLEDSIDAFAGTTVNVFGGNIEGAVSATAAVANISGGTVGEVAVALGPPGVMNVTGGTFKQGISVVAGATGTINGATVEQFDGNEINAALGATMTVESVEGVEIDMSATNASELLVLDFDATDASVTGGSQSEVQVDGGEADNLVLNIEGGSTLVLRGGKFGNIVADVQGDDVLGTSTLIIRGKEFFYNGIPLDDLNNQLPGAFNESTGELLTISGDITGTLRDGREFDMAYTRDFIPAAVGRVILEVVPEPSSVVLVALAGLLCTRRRLA